jgi:hypothetical protein
MHYLERFVALAVHAQCGQQKFLGIFSLKLSRRIEMRTGTWSYHCPSKRASLIKNRRENDERSTLSWYI